MGKFTKQFESLSIVGFCCVFTRTEPANVDCRVIESDFRKPLVPMFVPRDTFESTAVRYCQFLIPVVLASCALTKIISAIVQCLMVPMVSFFFWILASQDEAVHIDENSRFSPHGIKSAHFIFESGPIPLIQPFIVSGIYQRILSFSQWNQAVRWVRWLGDGMSLKPTFRHESSTKGFVLPSHFTVSAWAVQ